MISPNPWKFYSLFSQNFRSPTLVGSVAHFSTGCYVRGIKEATAQLAAGLSSASVEDFKVACKEHESRMAVVKSNLTWLAAIVVVSALVNVAVFVLMRWR